MDREAPAALRRFWHILWMLAVGLMLTLLFATLRERALSPEALEHFPREVLERGRQFTREVRLVATARDLLSLALLLGLAFHPLGARMMHRLERLGGGRLWLGLVVAALGMAVLTGLAALPFDYYLGYVHERSYGLMGQSPGEWLLDHLFNGALGTGLLLLLIIPLYLLIRRWPAGWWLPASALSLAFSATMTLLSPLIFLPLQGELVPARDPRLLAMVDRVAERAGVAVEQVQVLKVSARTSRANAMVTGLGPTKQVVLYDTLLSRFRPDEIEVVIAHELSHAAHGDVVTGMLLGGLVDAAMLFGCAWALRGMVGVGPLRLPCCHAARGLALVMLLTSLAGEVAAPVQHYASRRMEVRADQFALAATRNPGAFVSAFRKLAGENPGDVDPPALVEWLSHSHPSILRRIRMATDSGGHGVY